MKFWKRLAFSVYAVVAVAAVLIGCVVVWYIVVNTDMALIPVSGSSMPVAVPVPRDQEERTVRLDSRAIKVTIADTPAAQAKGLGDRSGLAKDEGMLFIFPRDDEYGFWMKDMHFSIDIIWLSSEGVVVHIEKNVSPNTYPVVFKPRKVARYVLELPAHYTEVYNVRPGSKMGL